MDPAALLRDSSSALVEAVQPTVRLPVEGRSSAQSPVSGWIERASAFELDAVEGGSTSVVLEARPVLDALPDQQLAMFASFDLGRSCLDLIIDGLADALAGQADGSLYDDGLLGTFVHFDRVFSHGIEAVELGPKAAGRPHRHRDFRTLRRDPGDGPPPWRPHATIVVATCRNS